MVLDTRKLSLFADASKRRLRICFGFALAPLRVARVQDALQLETTPPTSKCFVRCAEAELGHWERLLATHASSPLEQVFLSTAARPVYRFLETITPARLLATAKTGDLVLFQSAGCASAVQRWVTQSHYDHVGMLLQAAQGLCVLEANRTAGVAIYAWSSYLRTCTHYERIALRQLTHPRHSSISRRLLEFARASAGKPFRLSLGKLLRGETNTDWLAIEDYFCSELVAKAFKSAGLLCTQKASSTYWPVHFSEEAELPLKGGASLGREQIVLLPKHLRIQQSD